jgi:hypothetical protein
MQLFGKDRQALWFGSKLAAVDANRLPIAIDPFARSPRAVRPITSSRV